MANLLPSSRSSDAFPAFDPDQRARFEERARFLVSAPWTTLQTLRTTVAERFAAEIEELDEAPGLASAQALLAQLDHARREAALEPSDRGASALRWVLFRPGRSLSTGEAEIASRGFYDVADRPPPVLWVEAVGRPRAAGSEEIDVAILCAVPEAVAGAAVAGVEACLSGALASVAELAPDLARQLVGVP